VGLSGFKWVSLGFTGFYWVLLGFTGFYLVLPRFYWVLLGFTGFCLVDCFRQKKTKNQIAKWKRKRVRIKKMSIPISPTRKSTKSRKKKMNEWIKIHQRMTSEEMMNQSRKKLATNHARHDQTTKEK